MNINNFSQKIGDLIGNDDLHGAISLLSSLLKNSPKLDEVIVQSGRLSDIAKQIRTGTIDFEQADITKNKIRLALLNLVEEIEGIVDKNPTIKAEIDDIDEAFQQSQYIQNHSGTGDNVMNF